VITKKLRGLGKDPVGWQVLTAFGFALSSTHCIFAHRDRDVSLFCSFCSQNMHPSNVNFKKLGLSFPHL
jgi:hypothetical protein